MEWRVVFQDSRKEEHALFGTPSLVALLVYPFCRRFGWRESRAHGNIQKLYPHLGSYRDSERRISEQLVTTCRLSPWRLCVCDDFLVFSRPCVMSFFPFAFRQTHEPYVIPRKRLSNNGYGTLETKSFMSSFGFGERGGCHVLQFK